MEELRWKAEAEKFVRGSVGLEEAEWGEQRPPDGWPQLSKGLEEETRCSEQRAGSTAQQCGGSS